MFGNLLIISYEVFGNLLTMFWLNVIFLFELDLHTALCELFLNSLRLKEYDSIGELFVAFVESSSGGE